MSSDTRQPQERTADALERIAHALDMLAPIAFVLAARTAKTAQEADQIGREIRLTQEQYDRGQL